jgi:hypothetical protein
MEINGCNNLGTKDERRRIDMVRLPSAMLCAYIFDEYIISTVRLGSEIAFLRFLFSSRKTTEVILAADR